MKYLIAITILLNSCQPSSISDESTAPKPISTFGTYGKIYKVKIDSIEYIVVKNGSDGCAIIKHINK